MTEVKKRTQTKSKYVPRYAQYSTKVAEAVDYILDVRDGSEIPVRFGRPWLDDIYPVLNKSVITVGAGSGVGKSYELMKMMEHVLNEEYNPQAKDYVWLNFSFEMKVQSLVLRSLSKNLKKKMTDILYGDLTDEDAKEFDRITEEMEDDPRSYIVQDPTDPIQFKNDCEAFLEEHKDKKTVFISIDHLALFKSSNGENRNTIIEEVIMVINDLKLKYDNVIFILLSQLNGDRDKRLIDKNIMSQPKPTDLYYSGFTFQISDYVYIMVNPFKDKLIEYSYIIADMYPHLEPYFMEVDEKGRTSLETIGTMYFHLLKCRDADFEDLIDIYAETLPIRDRDLLIEQRDKDKVKKSTAVFDQALGKVVEANSVKIDRMPGATSTPSLLTKTKNSKPKIEGGFFEELPEVKTERIKPNFDLGKAFGEPSGPF